MIDKQLLKSTVESAIAGTEMFLVDVQVSPSNAIVVEIDSKSGIDIDACVAITRQIESVFDREVEDYELEVGSAGLTSPFKVRGQYEKNIGNHFNYSFCLFGNVVYRFGRRNNRRRNHHHKRRR